MARKSIEAAKAIGHSGINCHRNMGDPLLLKYADEGGLVILEEPGEMMEWYSAIVDKGRNLKGPASDYRYWNRPLQVTIFRKTGNILTRVMWSDWKFI